MNELTELLNFTYGLCEDGDYEDAVEYFDAVLEKDPGNARILNDKGVTLHNLDRNREAAACYDRALAIEPGNGEVWINKGAVLHALGEYREAVGCYDRALSIEESPRALTCKGISLGEMGRLEEALRHFERALGMDEDYDLAAASRQTAQELLRKEGSGVQGCQDP